MHLFGCKFASERDGDTLPDRKNFDSLLWAIVTVFQVRGKQGRVGGGGGVPLVKALTPILCLQILTQEDWNKVLYNGMASTSSWAALYFIALMTFGNYVLFNLLVAILVEGFQAEVTPRPQQSTSTRNWLPACALVAWEVPQEVPFRLGGGTRGGRLFSRAALQHFGYRVVVRVLGSWVSC